MNRSLVYPQNDKITEQDEAYFFLPDEPDFFVVPLLLLPALPVPDLLPPFPSDFGFLGAEGAVGACSAGFAGASLAGGETGAFALGSGDDFFFFQNCHIRRSSIKSVKSYRSYSTPVLSKRNHA